MFIIRYMDDYLNNNIGLPTKEVRWDDSLVYFNYQEHIRIPPVWRREAVVSQRELNQVLKGTKGSEIIRDVAEYPVIFVDRDKKRRIPTSYNDFEQRKKISDEYEKKMCDFLNSLGINAIRPTPLFETNWTKYEVDILIDHEYIAEVKAKHYSWGRIRAGKYLRLESKWGYDRKVLKPDLYLIHLTQSDDILICEGDDTQWFVEKDVKDNKRPNLRPEDYYSVDLNLLKDEKWLKEWYNQRRK